MQRNIQLLQNVHRSAEHSRHTYFLLLMLPFYLFSIIHISSPSLPSPLTSPSPPFISRYWSPSFVIVALALSFSLLLSLSNQMCSLYDLFRCKDWVWESVLQAECTLLEFKWLSKLPTLIADANESNSLYESGVLLFFWLKKLHHLCGHDIIFFYLHWPA